MNLESPSSSNFQYQSDAFFEFNTNDQDLIKLIPFGVQLSADGLRPLLILKDEKGESTMPVTLNALEAGVALTQSNKNIAPTTPHRVTELLLESLNLKIESCVFIEIKGAYQYVQLKLSGHPTVKFIKVRADEAMSFCLHFNVPLFATKDFMARSRVLTAEQVGVAKGILANPEVLNKTHRYVM